MREITSKKMSLEQLFPLCTCSGDSFRIVDFPSLFVLVTVAIRKNTKGESPSGHRRQKNPDKGPKLYKIKKKNNVLDTL